MVDCAGGVLLHSLVVCFVVLAWGVGRRISVVLEFNADARALLLRSSFFRSSVGSHFSTVSRVNPVDETNVSHGFG
jgi:hypothetical protein